MERPTDKLLKEMSNDELRTEADWHVAKAEDLLQQVRGMREKALDSGDDEAMELLRSASLTESEAEAHRHQSFVLLAACRPTDEATPIRRISAASKS
jgi:hypothetical protein